MNLDFFPFYKDYLNNKSFKQAWDGFFSEPSDVLEFKTDEDSGTIFFKDDLEGSPIEKEFYDTLGFLLEYGSKKTVNELFEKSKLLHSPKDFFKSAKEELLFVYSQIQALSDPVAKQIVEDSVLSNLKLYH